MCCIRRKRRANAKRPHSELRGRWHAKAERHLRCLPPKCQRERSVLVGDTPRWGRSSFGDAPRLSRSVAFFLFSSQTGFASQTGDTPRGRGATPTRGASPRQLSPLCDSLFQIRDTPRYDACSLQSFVIRCCGTSLDALVHTPKNHSKRTEGMTRWILAVFCNDAFHYRDVGGRLDEDCPRPVA